MKNQIARKMTKSEAYKKVMELESENTRIKALLADVYKFAMTYDKNWKIKHAELQARIKQEGV